MLLKPQGMKTLQSYLLHLAKPGKYITKGGLWVNYAMKIPYS